MVVIKNQYKRKNLRRKIYQIWRDTSVKYRKRGFHTELSTKTKKCKNSKYGRQDSWDVRLLWVKVNNQVVAINSKHLYISDYPRL